MRTLLLVATSLLVCSLPAHAGDNGVYLGGALSRSTIDTDANLLGFGFEDDDTAYKFIAGVRLTELLALEANYVNFGNIVFDNRNVVTDGIRSEYEADAIDAFVVGHIGGPFVEVIGKVGLVYWDATTVLQGGIGGLDLFDSDTGADLVYGAGVQLQFASLATRLEYENFDIGGAESIELWSLGLTWTFL